MFSKLVAAVVLCLPFIGQGVLAQNATCGRGPIVVQLGDTCNEISAKDNVSTFQLAFVNPPIDSSCSNLVEGELLCLGVAGQDCSIVHVVAMGDNCDTISEGAGIPRSTLLANNPNVDSNCDDIIVGEVLCTDSTIFNYTTTA